MIGLKEMQRGIIMKDKTLSSKVRLWSTSMREHEIVLLEDVKDFIKKLKEEKDTLYRTDEFIDNLAGERLI